MQSASMIAMVRKHEIGNINEIESRTEADELLEEIVHYENWSKVVSQILSEIIEDPDWLLSESVFPKYKIEMHQELISELKNEMPRNLEVMSKDKGTDEVTPLVIRFMEVFSKKFGYPYVYRGGSLEDLESSIRGTFTFFFDTSTGYVEASYGGDRNDPCLIALSVESLVEYFKDKYSKREVVSLVAEHGYDGVFDSSFDIFLKDYLPEDLVVYVLTKNNS